MESKTILKTNRAYWNANADEWFGVTALPEYGVQFATEDELHLFGDVAGKKMLEICCGSGHSIKYHADRGAGELWGLDISSKQLENAEKYLAEFGYHPKLICSPMEDDSGITENYFDYVYSIYGMGWATDLEAVFHRVASYLKKDGVFIFSWKHPIHGCVTVEGERLNFTNSYFDEEWHPLIVHETEMLLANRKISTYINALAGAGFVIEKMAEQTDEKTMALIGEMSDRSRKAQMLPLSFVFKARKA